MGSADAFADALKAIHLFHGQRASNDPLYGVQVERWVRLTLAANIEILTYILFRTMERTMGRGSRKRICAPASSVAKQMQLGIRKSV